MSCHGLGGHVTFCFFVATYILIILFTMLFFKFWILKLVFWMFSQKMPSDCHIHHMGMSQIEKNCINEDFKKCL